MRGQRGTCLLIVEGPARRGCPLSLNSATSYHIIRGVTGGTFSLHICRAMNNFAGGANGRKSQRREHTWPSGINTAAPLPKLAIPGRDQRHVGGWKPPFFLLAQRLWNVFAVYRWASRVRVRLISGIRVVHTALPRAIHFIQYATTESCDGLSTRANSRASDIKQAVPRPPNMLLVNI